jgi:hypothetical protein
MGIGDELMAAGEAKARAEREKGRTGRYLMLDKLGRAKWHFIWENNPNIARDGMPADGQVEYVNGRRPYLVDEDAGRRYFREYRPEPAFIALPESSRRLAGHAKGAVVFNPTVKRKAPVNKHWGIMRWRDLISRYPAVRWLQVGEPGDPRVGGAEWIATGSFFDACGLMMGARAVVCHEGALHHAAAALGTPAVVIRGGFISPKVTGYAGQVDLYVESKQYPLGCGMRIACAHCEAAMASIRPADVMRALESVWR